MPHFTCATCFNDYVRLTLVGDAEKVLDSGCKVTCQGPGCGPDSDPFDNALVTRILRGDALPAYIDVLQRLAMRNHGGQGGRNDAVGPGAEHAGLQFVIEEALTLRCPVCETFLDPTPDGYVLLRLTPAGLARHIRRCKWSPSTGVCVPDRINSLPL